ncbi:MAG: disulfide bond formation protein B [Alphaproteobacteria bacterium]|nr:disulfide bond formation protein B [Alphaproteobacteria bacterium]
MSKICTLLRNPRILSLLAAGMAAAALSFAYIGQYFFNLQPCHLCHLQRIPYFVTIGLGVLGAIAATKMPKATFFLLLLCALAFAVDAGIAVFHVGVEQEWWKGLEACGGGGVGPPQGASIEELRKYLEHQPIVNCGVPGWKMFGISMAGYNAIYAGAAAIFTIAHTLKGRKK